MDKRNKHTYMCIKSFLACENAAINAMQTYMYENEVQTRSSISVDFIATYRPLPNIIRLSISLWLITAIGYVFAIHLCQSFQQFFHCPLDARKKVLEH